MSQPELHSRVIGIFQGLMGCIGVLRLNYEMSAAAKRNQRLTQLAQTFNDLAAARQKTPPLVKLVLAKLLAEPVISEFRQRALTQQTRAHTKATCDTSALI